MSFFYDEGEDFYDSDEWDLEKFYALKNGDGTCERCGCFIESPHVHHVFGLRHVVYEILCHECHADHHDNDEIANYQGGTPRCTHCGIEISWKFKKIKAGRYKHVPYSKNGSATFLGEVITAGFSK